jgi:hypothetical protein
VKQVTLTFDNGPVPGITDRVLNILDRTGLKTTFFVIGGNLLDPDAAALMREAHLAGHWIGNHTLTHSVALGVKLRDRVGKDHPLKADVGCRNTLYNAVPQTAAEFLPRLLKHGARSLRIEFLDDSPTAIRRIISLYREVLAGKRDGKSLWRELKASNQYGVTRGPLAVIA